MEPLHTGDGLVGLSKKIPYIITQMLEPWIMAHNPWKKIALFYTRKSIQLWRFMRLPKWSNIKAWDLVIPLASFLNGLI
jgi:hypothetical protein